MIVCIQGAKYLQQKKMNWLTKITLHQTKINVGEVMEFTKWTTNYTLGMMLVKT